MVYIFWLPTGMHAPWCLDCFFFVMVFLALGTPRMVNKCYYLAASMHGYHEGTSMTFLYSASVFSSFPTGVTVGTRMAGWGQQKSRQKGGDAPIVTVGLFQPQMLFWWKVLPIVLWHIPTTWLCKVPEFKLLGVEVFEARRKIYRIWIICCFSASVANELAKQSLKFPTEHLK